MRKRVPLLVICLIGPFFTSLLRAEEFDRAKLLAQLIKHEGKKTRVYEDSKGIRTVGVGFNLKREDAQKRIEELGLNYTQVLEGKQELEESQIMKLFEADVDVAVVDCKSLFPKFTDLSDVRQRVLIDMMFNLGKPSFAKFKKMIRHVNDANFDDAAKEMKDSDWYKQVKRRGETLVEMMRSNRDPK